jgi:Domain of unknown function (DUF1844)
VAEAEKQAPKDVSADEAAEQLRAIKVSDLIVQAASGLVSLGFVRLAGEQRDFAQARLAIDSLRALEPIVREQVSVELSEELQRAIASLQLAFAEAVNEKAAPDSSAVPEPESGSGEPAEAGTSESGE